MNNLTNNSAIKKAIAVLIEHSDLSHKEVELIFEEILTGKATASQIACFLTALRVKGETVEEITAAAQVMRRFVTKICAKDKTILDTCGTGGDYSGTFNISTVSAFVAAGAGVRVAKHGNRSISSHCGSADVLEGLGININISVEKVEDCLEKNGIAFLFAPILHPAMKYAQPVRQEIGIRTIFNILGPLTNPAGAAHQLIGVYDDKWVKPLAEVLLNLGSKHALIVHGKDGIDEVTTTTKTFVAEVKNKKVKTFEITPSEFGIKKASLSDLCDGSVESNVEIVRDVLAGKKGAKRDIVILNAGCAIYAADYALTIEEGMKKAKESIDSGKAAEKLEMLREFTSSITLS
ncbi:MAG: anthranilate phosphoribosyltransferase [Candidatus Omnitrophota bacterium]